MRCRAYLDIRLNLPVFTPLRQTLLNLGKVPKEVSAARRLAIGHRQRASGAQPFKRLNVASGTFRPFT